MMVVSQELLVGLRLVTGSQQKVVIALIEDGDEIVIDLPNQILLICLTMMPPLQNVANI